MTPAEVNRLWRNAADYTYEDLKAALEALKRMKKPDLYAAVVAIGIQHAKTWRVARLRREIEIAVLEVKYRAMRAVIRQRSDESLKAHKADANDPWRCALGHTTPAPE